MICSSIDIDMSNLHDRAMRKEITEPVIDETQLKMTKRGRPAEQQVRVTIWGVDVAGTRGWRREDHIETDAEGRKWRRNKWLPVQFVYLSRPSLKKLLKKLEGTLRIVQTSKYSPMDECTMPCNFSVPAGKLIEKLADGHNNWRVSFDGRRIDIRGYCDHIIVESAEENYRRTCAFISLPDLAEALDNNGNVIQGDVADYDAVTRAPIVETLRETTLRLRERHLDNLDDMAFDDAIETFRKITEPLSVLAIVAPWKLAQLQKDKPQQEEQAA
jgi:hypothetical protein